MDLSKYGIDLNTTSPTGTTPTATVPGLDSLQSMFGIVTIASVVIGVIFLVLYIVTVAQRMRADRAMVAMRQDIAAIKSLLEQQLAPRIDAPAPTPASTDQLIATTPAPTTDTPS